MISSVAPIACICISKSHECIRRIIDDVIWKGTCCDNDEGRLKFDDNPFPGDQNMVDARLLKGKTKVLTSTKSREARTVDPEMQISADDQQKSRYEQGETSKDGTARPRVTS